MTAPRNYFHPRTLTAALAARYALAALWLLDGALQLQPFMFTRGFAHDVLLPAGDGQPGFVAAPLHASAQLIAAHPVASNTTFAAVQLLIGVGLLAGRTARVALAISVGWSLAIWWLGEGLGGLLSGHAMLLTGAPGAVLLYVALAALAWPSSRTAPARSRQRRVALASWTALWLLGAVYQLLPGQNSGRAIAAAITDATADGPGWLAHAGSSLAGQLPTGVALAVALAAVQALIGLLVLTSGPARRIALGAGAALAVGFWVFGQGLGELSTGQATDPNTGPVLVLLAAVCWAACSRHAAGVDAHPASTAQTRRRDPGRQLAAAGSRPA